MVADDAEERHLQHRQARILFVPHLRQLRGVVGITFDHVAGIDDELRLQQVDAGHRLLEHAGAGKASAVAEQREFEIAVVVVELLVAPGFGGCRRNFVLEAGGLLAGAQ
jgi:hypothetical protein